MNLRGQNEFDGLLTNIHATQSEFTMGDSVEKIVDEELQLAKTRILTRINRNQSIAQRRMKLAFKNRISQPILTGEEIKGEGGTSIRVDLIDESTGEIVNTGPEASATVKIFVLKGTSEDCGGHEWTSEEFSGLIVQETVGKLPFLKGNMCLKLERGTVFLDDIKLRNHIAQIKPSVFRLGARIVGAFEEARVKEAKTEPFPVKDFRNKYTQKREIPHLADDVCRLVNIRKGGKIEKRLRLAKIENVEQFLIRHLIDPQGLKSIVNLGQKKWEATIRNARNCRLEQRLYCYIQDSSDQKKMKRAIVFNVLGHVLALYSKNQDTPTTIFSSADHKAVCDKLLQSAYEHWEDTESFDSENSLQEYLSSFIPHIDPMPDIYSSCSEDPFVISKPIGESRNGHSSSSFKSLMNSTVQETTIEDFVVETTSNPTLEHNLDHFQFNPDHMPSVWLDDFFSIIDDNCDRQHPRDTNTESNGNENDGTADQSQHLRICEAMKRWKILFFVSKLFVFWKLKSVRGTPNRKKQKLG